jgi:hypothetical protein
MDHVDLDFQVTVFRHFSTVKTLPFTKEIGYEVMIDVTYRF